MKKGVVIGIIIAIVVIGMISAYSISQNSNEIIPADVIPETTGVNHSIELTEGLTMTAPGP